MIGIERHVKLRMRLIHGFEAEKQIMILLDKGIGKISDKIT